MRVVHPDTDVTPYDMGTLGSRSTVPHGQCGAARRRGRAQQARALAAEAGLPRGTNYPAGGDFPEALRHAGRQRHRHRQLHADYKSPDPKTGQSDNVTPFWMVGGAGVEVEVDTETGHVRVTRLINVADGGTPINPGIAQTQLSGAAIMQLGFTMSEDMVFDGGQVTNASLADYKIPGIHDIPPMENELVDAEQQSGPFGAKGVGESGDVRRLAGDRQRHPRCRRRAAHRAADHRRRACSRAARRRRASRSEDDMMPRTIRFTLNGAPVAAESSRTVIWSSCCSSFDLFGARESCGQGLCGCCTVLVDDVAVSGASISRRGSTARA